MRWFQFCNWLTEWLMLTIAILFIMGKVEVPIVLVFRIQFFLFHFSLVSRFVFSFQHSVCNVTLSLLLLFHNNWNRTSTSQLQLPFARNVFLGSRKMRVRYRRIIVTYHVRTNNDRWTKQERKKTENCPHISLRHAIRSTRIAWKRSYFAIINSTRYAI